MDPDFFLRRPCNEEPSLSIRVGVTARAIQSNALRTEPDLDELTQPEGSTPAGSSSEEVARGFRKGDTVAVERVRARVRRIVRFQGYGVPPEDRHDIEQEVMSQLWQSASRDRFDVSAGFWGLVGTVTVRRCIDWLRTRRSNVELVATLEETSPGPLGKLLKRERRELADEAFSELGKPCRDLINLHAGLQLPYRKIAGILGKSEGALRVQMSRCLQQARQIVMSRLEPTRADRFIREVK